MRRGAPRATPTRSARRRAVVLLGAALVTATGCRAAADAGTTALDAAATTVSTTSTSTTTSATRSASTSASAGPSTASSTTSSTSTSTSTSTTSAPPAPRRITLAFTGDTLPHSPLWRQAARNAEPGDGFDFGPMLVGLRPVLDAVDLAVCHLETPIAPAGEEYTTMPRYGVPAEIADALASAGYDRCSTASNHTADRGIAGIERTVDVLEAAGITQSGMARRPAEIEPRVFDVGGVAVSHLSYTWSYNGLSLPEGDEWRSALIDPDRILADARRARELGAELVVVSLHWGAEGVHEPTPYQRDVADAITAPGLVDLVVGHHAHVLQPIERVNDTWVVYGLGNILSNLPTSDRWPAASQDAAVVTVSFTIAPDGSVTVARPDARATWVDRDAGWVVRLVDDELARADLPAGRRALLERSRDRTTAVLGDFLVTSH